MKITEDGQGVAIEATVIDAQKTVSPIELKEINTPRGLVPTNFRKAGVCSI